LDPSNGHGELIDSCHPEITAVIQREAPRLDHLFSSMLSQPIADLAAGLASLLPESLSKYIFLSTGSETAECSIKMAKLYTGKWEIVGFSTGYRMYLTMRVDATPDRRSENFIC
jgi:2,2-dialkylglycine decarboxylase (pyruvate)